MFPDLTRDDVFRLETRRLWLRWPRAADTAAIAAVASRKEVAEQSSRIPHPYPKDAANSYVVEARRYNALGEALNLVLTLRSGNRDVIGFISAEMKSETRAEIGYALHPDYWGEGYMPEAVAALVDTLFSLTPVRDISATIRAGNDASRRVLEKNGFRQVAQGHCHVTALGSHQPSLVFNLDARQWQGQSHWGLNAAASSADRMMAETGNY